jgi:hypothetical protein
MEFLYETGFVKIFKEDSNSFVIYSSTINKPHLSIIGDFIDNKGIVKRVRRDSVFGKKILELCSEEVVPLEISESQKKLAELIKNIG